MNDEHPAGLVGVIAQDTARFSMFGASLTSLAVPWGTQIKWLMGHAIAAQCNELVRTLLATDGDWLWILGDDHVFSGDILMRLLEHDCDIVAPLCLTRNPPYKPVLFAGWDEERGAPWRRRVDLNDHPDSGLIEVHSAGTAGMLIRRDVFEHLEEPWFEAGKISSVEIGEDVYFCDKARDAGYGIFGDLDTKLGHCTTATVWPVKEDAGWTYGFGFMGGLKLTMPPGAWEEADRVLEETS